MHELAFYDLAVHHVDHNATLKESFCKTNNRFIHNNNDDDNIIINNNAMWTNLIKDKINNI